MTAGSRMDVIPEKVCVRIHPRLVLRGNSGVDEIVASGLPKNAKHAQPNAEDMNVDDNAVASVSFNYGRYYGVQSGAIVGRGEIEPRHAVGVAERIRDGAEWWNVRDEKISGAGVGQPHDQVSDAISSIVHPVGAVIVKKIVPAAPDYVERIRIRGMGGEIIINLLANIIDGDTESATGEWQRVIKQGPVLCAILGRGAAECIISSAIEAVRCLWQTQKCLGQLLVPRASVQVCGR